MSRVPDGSKKDQNITRATLGRCVPNPTLTCTTCYTVTRLCRSYVHGQFVCVTGRSMWSRPKWRSQVKEPRYLSAGILRAVPRTWLYGFCVRYRLPINNDRPTTMSCLITQSPYTVSKKKTPIFALWCNQERLNVLYLKILVPFSRQK